MSCAMSGGLAKLLGGEENKETIRVNDAFYLQNFKGIKNIGNTKHSGDQKSTKEGNSDINGFDKYLNLHLKVA